MTAYRTGGTLWDEGRWFYMGVLAVALLAALPVTHALADPPVAEEVKDHPGKEPTVTRGMPDLVRYWNFDPPKSPVI